MARDEYDCWVFDLDGTLVDVERSYVSEVFDEVGRRLGCGFDDAEYEAIWHDIGGVRGRVFEREGITETRFWEVFDAVADPESRAQATYLFDDATAVADLEAPTAIVTHCPDPVTDAVLDELDIRDWFDAVVCCSPDLGMKPDPTPVHHALARMGVGPGRSGVLVGDSGHDVGAAWNAGLDGAHVERRDPHHRGYCVVGDHRVSRLTEFEALGS
mgnify:CR=1 FL=1|jgi:phosphoglycolate phosphatase